MLHKKIFNYIKYVYQRNVGGNFGKHSQMILLRIILPRVRFPSQQEEEPPLRPGVVKD
jgi:hypothetical protein